MGVRKTRLRHGLSGALAIAGVGLMALPAGAAKDDLDLVSRATGGAPVDDTSGFSSISPDGRHIAFATSADNISAEDDNTFSNVFVRDLQANTTTLVSTAETGDSDKWP